MPVLVSPHATLALWPMITNGADGRVTPLTSSPPATTCTSYQIDGISTARCGSLASSGRPVALRVGATTQLLLPPARAPTSSQARPAGNGGSSTRAATTCATAGSGPRVRRVRPGRRTRSAALDNGRGAGWPLAHQAAGFRGANGRRQPSADELTPSVLGKAPRHQAGHRERVDRRPRLRRNPKGKKFRWAPPAAHLGDGGIHAAAVLLESVAHQRRRGLPLLAGRTAQPQADEPLVHANRRRAEHFGEPAAGGAAIELHLPEPFATVQKPHGEPGVIGVTRVDVRHAVSVEEDLDGGRQAGKAHLAVKAGIERRSPNQAPAASPITTIAVRTNSRGARRRRPERAGVTVSRRGGFQTRPMWVPTCS